MFAEICDLNLKRVVQIARGFNRLPLLLVEFVCSTDIGGMISVLTLTKKPLNHLKSLGKDSLNFTLFNILQASFELSLVGNCWPQQCHLLFAQLINRPQ